MHKKETSRQISRKRFGGTGEEIGNRGHQIPPLIQSNSSLETASVEVDVGPTGQGNAAAADKGLSLKNNCKGQEQGSEAANIISVNFHRRPLIGVVAAGWSGLRIGKVFCSLG